MIRLINSAPVTLAAGEALPFDLTALHTGCGRSERHQAGSSVTRLLQSGYYQAFFTANVGAVAAGVAQISMQVDGETVPGGTAISTTAAAGDLNNVAIVQPIYNLCCDRNQVTIVNTGTEAITIGAGASLFIKRIG